jgi:hypothetical protein
MHIRKIAANATNGWLDLPLTKGDGEWTVRYANKAGHLNVHRVYARKPNEMSCNMKGYRLLR